MKPKKARNLTAAMQRALSMVGANDPCQLGGLQKLAADDMQDCRVLDYSAGKFPQMAGETRPWYDAVESYQRMRTKGHKSKNRSGNCKVDVKRGKPSDLGCYAIRQKVKS